MESHYVLVFLSFKAFFEFFLLLLCLEKFIRNLKTEVKFKIVNHLLRTIICYKVQFRKSNLALEEGIELRNAIPTLVGARRMSSKWLN